MPSFCANAFDGTFIDFLSTSDHAENWLSQAHRAVWGNHSPLLVKYIDSEDDLSLQLHPSIEAHQLPKDQSGKWESWLILKNRPHAGIYLGLEPHVTREEFLNAIIENRDIKHLLHFVPTCSGELYVIPPCTIHALGAGLCVLEPQLIQPGKKAVSLRLFDWNRKYDKRGNLSESGKPREIHLKQALEYIDFNTPRGRELENKCRVSPIILHETNKIRLVEYSLKPWLMTRFITGTGTISQPLPGEMVFISVMQGKISFKLDDNEYELRCGESGAIAASADEMLISCDKARVYMAHCLPNMYSECAKGRL